MITRQYQRITAWFTSKLRRRSGQAMEVAATGDGHDAGTSESQPDKPLNIQRILQKMAMPQGRAWLRGLTFLFLLAAAFGLWQGTRINRLINQPLVLPSGEGQGQMGTGDVIAEPLGQVADLSVRHSESAFDQSIPLLTLPEVLFLDESDRQDPAQADVAEPTVVVPVLPEIIDLNEVIWPVVGKIAEDYGWHRDPATSDWRFRAGLLLEPEREHASVRASLPGVVQTINTSGNGYRLVVDHAEGWSTEYVGLSSVDVIEGQSVASGDRIGDVQIAPHRPGLYFVMRDASGPVNPTGVLYTPPQ